MIPNGDRLTINKRCENGCYSQMMVVSLALMITLIDESVTMMLAPVVVIKK